MHSTDAHACTAFWQTHATADAAPAAASLNILRLTDRCCTCTLAIRTHGVLQVEKAGMTVGIRAITDKGYEMDELEVRGFYVLFCTCYRLCFGFASATSQAYQQSSNHLVYQQLIYKDLGCTLTHGSLSKQQLSGVVASWLDPWELLLSKQLSRHTR
eukprot:GHUV01040591.1.p1 GENE.GHUV01040591.1~~GHUV01040591.1.p1  ORF type:complete len:157 (-),score=45.93 GHUV01040591.1:19-489(-)